jgi:glycine/D-amino acid oxidase-like deaminating enzyme
LINVGSARQNNLTAFVEIQEASHLKSQYDAIVVGAGSAGVAAAICAARAGLSTLLVERNSSPGGGVEGACVHSLCGLYLSSPDAIARPANGGFALEFAERLLKSGSAIGPVRME